MASLELHDGPDWISGKPGCEDPLKALRTIRAYVRLNRHAPTAWPGALDVIDAVARQALLAMCSGPADADTPAVVEGK